MNAIMKADAVDFAGELPQIFKLATALSKAQGFLPQHIRSEGELVAVILAGRELGLPPMVSLRSIHLVKGRVTMSADMQLALMMRAGAKVQWLYDGSNGVAQLQVTRPGQEPHISSFSMEDAQRAQLAGGENWKKYPAAMLRARCVSSAARAIMPDVLAGIYTPEELQDETKPATRAHHVQDAEFSVVPNARESAPVAALSAGQSPIATTAAALDEYGLEVPTSPCPRVSDKAKKYAGKLWSDVPGPLVASWLEKDADKMSEHQKVWAVYLLAKRQARKAREAEQAAALDTASEGGAWVTGEDDAEPANVQAAGEEAAQ